MKIEMCKIPGMAVITPERIVDSRGFFSEIWNRETLRDAGLHLPEFVQQNHSISVKQNTLRGLHFQSPPHAQGKLVRCGRGCFLDIAVDVRKGSPTYGHWVGTELSFENARQLWIPEGFLHGFATRVPDTEIVYTCTRQFAPECQGTVQWDSLSIDWGLLDNPVLSEKDRSAMPFAEFESPFVWQGSE